MLSSHGALNYNVCSKCPRKHKEKEKYRRGLRRARRTLKVVDGEEEEDKGKQRITRDDERGNIDDYAFNWDDGDN